MCDSDSEYTHIDQHTSKPDSYKNINSSQTLLPASDSSQYSYVVMYNDKPYAIIDNEDDAQSYIHNLIKDIHNSVEESYYDSYNSCRISLTHNGYELVEYNPYIPFFYDNIILHLSFHKVKLFKN